MLEAERRKMEAEVMEKRRKYQEEAQLGSRHAEIRRRPRQWSSFNHLNGWQGTVKKGAGVCTFKQPFFPVFRIDLRLQYSQARIWLRILLFSHKSVERTEIMIAN
jgi:hypothetical protein